MSRTRLINKRSHSKELNSLNEMVQSLDEQGHIIDVSPKWLEKTGYQKEEVIGHFFGDFLSADSLKSVQKAFPHLKDLGFIDNQLLVLKRKDSTYFEAVLNGTSVYDEHNNFIQTFCELRTLEFYMRSAESTKELLAKERFLKTISALRADISRLLLKPLGITDYLSQIETLLTKPSDIVELSGPELDGKYNDTSIAVQITETHGHHSIDLTSPLNRAEQRFIVQFQCPVKPDIFYQYTLTLNTRVLLLPLWKEALYDLFRLIHTGLSHIHDINELAETKQQLESLVNNVNAIGYEINLEQERFTLVSPRIKAILDYEPEEWQMLDDWFELIHPEDRAALYRFFHKNTDTNEAAHCEFRIRHKNGDYVWLLCHHSYEISNQRREKAHGVFIDISEQKRTQASLNESMLKAQALSKEQQSLLALFDIGDVVLFKWKNDSSWSVEHVSHSVQHLLGYKPEAFLKGKIAYADCIHPEDLARVQNEVLQAIKDKVNFFRHQPYRIITAHQQIKWMADITYVMRNDQNEITHFLGYLYDTTLEQEAQQQLESILNLQENIVIVSDGRRLLFANQKFNDFFGFQNLEAFLKKHRCICEFFVDELQHYSKNSPDADWMHEIQKLPPEKRIVRMQNSEGIPTSFLVKQAKLSDQTQVITFSDITATLNERNFYRYLAQHDQLTGAYNREYLYHKFDQLRAAADRTHKQLALIMFDIDHFKKINDHYGHNIGDAVLKTLTNLVSESIRIRDILVRWGGEEFIVLADVDAIESAAALAEHLRYHIEGHHFKSVGNITASFGVTLSRDREPLKVVIERADRALYTAKNAGRNRVKTEDFNEPRKPFKTTG